MVKLILWECVIIFYLKLCFSYFQQIFSEACCYEWCLLISILLRDAMGVIRTLNSARSSDVPLDVTQRLQKSLEQLQVWTESEW